MSFGAPEWFWGFAIIPLLVALFMRAEQRARRRLQEFVSARLLPQLAGTVNRSRRVVRFGLQLLGLALALVSLAQPRWGYTFQDVKRKGLDLLVAIDTSRSMLSNDVQPNRLDRVKLVTQDLIDQLQGDRVGLHRHHLGMLLGRRVETSERWSKGLTLEKIRSGEFERMGWAEWKECTKS